MDDSLKTVANEINILREIVPSVVASSGIAASENESILENQQPNEQF